MKYLILIAVVALFSCSNGAGSKQAYKDSAEYYSKKMAEITDHPIPDDVLQAAHEKTLMSIYTAKRQYFIDLMNGK